MFDAAVESVQVSLEPEIQDWNLPEPDLSIAAEPQVDLQPIEEPTAEAELPVVEPQVSEIEADAPDIESATEPETQAGGAGQFTSWESTARTEDFQVFVFRCQWRDLCGTAR